jgi:hypothetical protein
MKIKCPVCDAEHKSDNDWDSRPLEDALRDRAEAAEKRVAELEAASRWIPVSEKLPEKNKKVLLYDSWSGQIDSGTLRRIDGHDEAIQEGIYEWDTDGCYYHGDNFERITHWRELPQPPKPEEGK